MFPNEQTSIAILFIKKAIECIEDIILDVFPLTRVSLTYEEQKTQRDMLISISELANALDAIDKPHSDFSANAASHLKALKSLYDALEIFASCVDQSRSGGKDLIPCNQATTSVVISITTAILKTQEVYRSCTEQAENNHNKRIFERMGAILELAVSRLARSPGARRHGEVIFEKMSDVNRAAELLSNVTEENSASAARYFITQCVALFIVAHKAAKHSGHKVAHSNFDIIAAIVGAFVNMTPQYFGIDITEPEDQVEVISDSLLIHIGLAEGLALVNSVNKNLEHFLSKTRLSNVECINTKVRSHIKIGMHNLQCNIMSSLGLLESRGHGQHFDQRKEPDHSIAAQVSKNLYDAQRYIMYIATVVGDKIQENVLLKLLKTSICLERVLDRVDESRILYEHNWSSTDVQALLPVFPGEVPDRVICKSTFSIPWEAFTRGEYKDCVPNSWSYSIHKNCVSWVPWVTHNIKNLLLGGNEIFDGAEEPQALFSDHRYKVSSELSGVLTITHGIKDKLVRDASDYMQLSL